jgi:hypothetical protein
MKNRPTTSPERAQQFSDPLDRMRVISSPPRSLPLIEGTLDVNEDQRDR